MTSAHVYTKKVIIKEVRAVSQWGRLTHCISVSLDTVTAVHHHDPAVLILLMLVLLCGQCLQCSRLHEKLVFVTSVSSMVLMAYALVVVQWLLPYYYAISAPLLIGLRVCLYMCVSQHLFDSMTHMTVESWVDMLQTLSSDELSYAVFVCMMNSLLFLAMTYSLTVMEAQLFVC